MSVAELKAQVFGETSAEAVTWSYIQNVRTGLYLAVSGSSDANGAPILQWEKRTGNQEQAWTFTETSYPAGYMAIRNAGTSSWKAMGISRSGLHDGAPAIQWDYRPGLEDQIWGFYGGTLGVYRLQNLNSGKCLAIPGSNPARGVHAVQWECSSNLDQAWAVTSWP
ncbi:RICIN domain-containing protein [Actinoplanes auranticolor]|uniref:RICIN domain-containing protein n=1 Tax=Actinoplanes auranticolor TaxID=47988 RepID=UPI001BB3B364|nr:RICIN domain-containing protein [Actinoplanes auranticolor]